MIKKEYHSISICKTCTDKLREMMVQHDRDEILYDPIHTFFNNYGEWTPNCVMQSAEWIEANSSMTKERVQEFIKEYTL